MAFGTQSNWSRPTALICTVLLALGEPTLIGQQPKQPSPQEQAAPETPKSKTADELDSLVAPIALYPDPLLAQVLAASTYPLEVVQAQRWSQSNTKLKGEKLTEAASKQPWDPSVQALVAFPEALKLLDSNIQWTTELGNTFLDQQNEVMDAVQRMRKKAKEGGKLQSSKEQKVEEKNVENKTVIEIQPANTQVFYVPSYNPTVVYGPPAYAYPAVYYPPPPPPGAYVAASAISFGVGVAMGAFWGGCCGGGGWGWGCHWEGGHNTINVNNEFHTRYGYSNFNGGNRVNATSRSAQWQHNPRHRESVPYGNRATAQRYGGSARTATGVERFNRTGQPRTDGGQARNLGAGQGRAQTRDVSANRDRVGNQSIERSNPSNQRSAFGGSDSQSRVQAASDRGFSSSRESRLGGGGGGRSLSGGGRGGGGGRRR